MVLKYTYISIYSLYIFTIFYTQFTLFPDEFVQIIECLILTKISVKSYSTVVRLRVLKCITTRPS